MSLSDRVRPNVEAAPWVVDEIKKLEVQKNFPLSERERRVLLDLIDEEHARDCRTFEAGRTTGDTFQAQTSMYKGLRAKLVAISPIPDSAT
jgi:hypothetical protein